MDFPELLAELDRRRIILELGPGQTVAIEGPPRSIDDELAAVIREHRLWLRWTVVGAATDHYWRICDQCGQWRLTRARRDAACNLTPQCPGRLIDLGRWAEQGSNTTTGNKQRTNT